MVSASIVALIYALIAAFRKSVIDRLGAENLPRQFVDKYEYALWMRDQIRADLQRLYAYLDPIRRVLTTVVPIGIVIFAATLDFVTVVKIFVMLGLGIIFIKWWVEHGDAKYGDYTVPVYRAWVAIDKSPIGLIIRLFYLLFLGLLELIRLLFIELMWRTFRFKWVFAGTALEQPLPAPEKPKRKKKRMPEQV
jgi:hypothetical protein